MPDTADSLAPAKTRVLVLDDRPAMRDVFRDVLELSGCQVAEARSLAEALAILDADPVEVAVVADNPGRHLVAALRARRAPMRIVAVCESCAMPAACGADSCLSGQFSACDLALAVAGQIKDVW